MDDFITASRPQTWASRIFRSPFVRIVLAFAGVILALVLVQIAVEVVLKPLEA